MHRAYDTRAGGLTGLGLVLRFSTSPRIVKARTLEANTRFRSGSVNSIHEE